MANIRFRAPSIYINGKKMGTIEGVKEEIDAGDEPQFGDPGFLGFSDGAITTKISATGVVPTQGCEFDLVTAMKNKMDLDIAVGIVDGKIHQCNMRCLKAQFTGSHKNGTQMGEFEFQGSEPNVTG
jgi:hypothetical protein